MQVKQAAINQTLLPNMYMELQKPRALQGTLQCLAVMSKVTDHGD